MDWFPITSGKCHALGLSLHPLSLGHVFLLYEYQSPFVLGGEATCGDLAVASFICSSPYAQTVKNLSSPWRKILFWMMTKKRWDWTGEDDRFRAYIATSLSLPQVRLAQNEKNTVNTPWPYYLLAQALGYGFSHNDAMNLPLSHVNRVHIANQINRGALKEWTDENEDFWQWCKEQDALKDGNR